MESRSISSDEIANEALGYSTGVFVSYSANAGLGLIPYIGSGVRAGIGALINGTLTRGISHKFGSFETGAHWAVKGSCHLVSAVIVGTVHYNINAFLPEDVIGRGFCVAGLQATTSSIARGLEFGALKLHGLFREYRENRRLLNEALDAQSQDSDDESAYDNDAQRPFEERGQISKEIKRANLLAIQDAQAIIQKGDGRAYGAIEAPEEESQSLSSRSTSSAAPTPTPAPVSRSTSGTKADEQLIPVIPGIDYVVVQDMFSRTTSVNFIDSVNRALRPR